MINNDMDISWNDDVVESFADFLIKKNVLITMENKKDIIEEYKEKSFNEGYTEDLKRVCEYFSPHIDELKKAIELKLQSCRDNAEVICIYGDALSNDLRIKFKGGGYNYSDESFVAFINEEIPLKDAQISLSRTYDGFEGFYSYELEVVRGEAIYWSGIEITLQKIYRELKETGAI